MPVDDGLGGAPGGGPDATALPSSGGDVLVEETVDDVGPGEEEAHRSAVDAVDALLDEVELALSRLDDGTYGRCEECGTPIDDSRLAASPTVRSCGACVIGGGAAPEPTGAPPAATVAPPEPTGSRDPGVGPAD
jgi:hypothetical protein